MTQVRSQVPTGRASGNVITQDYQTKAYAANIAITPTVEETIVAVAALTGIATLTAVVTSAMIGDKLIVQFIGDSVDRVITFSTGFGGVTTLTVPGNGGAIARFSFYNSLWVCETTGAYTSLAADVQTPAYGASIAITTTAHKTEVIPAQLTGALTLTAVLTNAVAGDTMDMLFSADTTARVVTFSTGITAGGTLTVPKSSYAGIRFVYNGTAWIEVSRDDNRGGVDVQAPAYSATLTMVTTKRLTTYQPALLTGALTINATVTSAIAGDLLYVSFIADGTNRVVTFGTNFQTSGTLTVTASKWGGASFVFNGTYWVAAGREISA